MALRLEELSATTAAAANSITLRPGQEQFATPPSYATAGALLDPAGSWPRVVLDGDHVVGFIRGNFDPDSAHPEFRSCIWRVHVAGEAQGRGVGRFAVHGLADEARQRGVDRLTALWEPGSHGPEGFFTRIGFEVVGQTPYGEHIGAMAL